ncbi:MAG: SDR family NAD(P)-dependent oxidoreductase [Actinomycetota bacterium]
MELAGKVVVITGASRGIGADLARGFAEAGSRVALCARSTDQLEEVAESVRSLGAEAVVVPLDVEDRTSIQTAVERVRRDLGPIDVLVNNAGVDKVWSFADIAVDDIEWIVRVNLLGLLLTTRLVVPHMVERGRGHVVNMSSAAGLAPVPYGTVYSATKHAVVGFSRSLRIELASRGVAVSVVCPGYVVGEGMFADSGQEAPRAAGAVTVGEVTAATLACVRKNKPEVVVAPVTNRVADLAVAISPSAFAAGMRRTGVVDFYRRWAERNAADAGSRT